MSDFIGNIVFACVFIIAVVVWLLGTVAFGICAMEWSPWMWLPCAGWFVIYPPIAVSSCMCFDERDERRAAKGEVR